MNQDQALKLCAILEGLLPEGQEMTDEIRAEAAKRLEAIGFN